LRPEKNDNIREAGMKIGRDSRMPGEMRAHAATGEASPMPGAGKEKVMAAVRGMCGSSEGRETATPRYSTQWGEGNQTTAVTRHQRNGTVTSRGTVAKRLLAPVSSNGITPVCPVTGAPTRRCNKSAIAAFCSATAPQRGRARRTCSKPVRARERQNGNDRTPP